MNGSQKSAMPNVEETHAPNVGNRGAHPAGNVFVFPTSFAQQRLWLLDQLEPNSALYSLPAALRLRGRLDVQALKSSLIEIAQRHESLRTTFDSKDGQPFQVIHATAEISF